MKRLKLKQPFRGYESRVLIIAVFISPFAGLAALSLSEDKQISFVLPFILTAFVLFLALAYFIMSHTNTEEKYLIEQAPEYNWQTPDDWMYPAVRNKHRIPWIEIIIGIVLFAVFIVVFIFKADDLSMIWLPLAVGGGIILLWIILCAVQQQRWAAIDSSAEFTTLEAHNTYTVKHYGRHNVYIYEYYVFYTPDGRIILKKEHSNCNKVCVIKFNGMITYIEYADKRKYDY